VGMQSRNFQHSGAQDFMSLEGSSAVPAREVEGAEQPAGCSTTARTQQDGPVIWEALSVLHENNSSVGRSKVNGWPWRRRQLSRTTRSSCCDATLKTLCIIISTLRYL